VDRTPTDRAFVTATDDEGKTSVVFGNGREGARLPTGIENVKATYRSGIGKAGNVRAGQVTTLATRPLGVREVVNPLRSSGGADREGRGQIRRNAPNAVMALDRLVSTRDYADFTRTFAGIAKAAAVELSDGRQRIVHVTIAGADDIPIDTNSDLFINLRRALRDLGDPFQPIELATRELLLLVLEAQVRILADFRWESVIAEVRARLLDTFGFERRELAQDVTSGEVIRVIQTVRGIAYVDLDVFGVISATRADPRAERGRRPLTPVETANAVNERILSKAPQYRVGARPASRDGDAIRAAELAIFVPDVAASLVLNQLK
jgi:predicted phage baseplate assembly protein